MSTILGAIRLLLVSINTVLASVGLFILAPFKAMPAHSVKRWVRSLSESIAEGWIGINNALISTTGTRWGVDMPQGLDRDSSYLVVSNHQSWVDILVLQRVLNRKIPFMRFFIKQQLIWVPVIGLAWWALDFPFMRRYSREQVRKKPELKGKDLETARRACEKFRDMPTSMMSFLEGTRLTAAKQKRQGSPYRNLLLPRVGGVSQVFHAMADSLKGVVDVTIVYKGEAPTLWQLLCGRIPQVLVDVRRLAIDGNLLGQDSGDADFRERLASWADSLWQAKDERIDALRAGLV
ncbi:MAG: acyltransferase [Lysobacteraceae bacterium]|nr:MAG: acyltransferase [Xanthomonadaceae bacterium]